MSNNDLIDTEGYFVVVNDEGQYSIMLSIYEADPLPRGWKKAGKSGSKDECLAFIEENWTDLTPLSVRKVAGPHDSDANARKAPAASKAKARTKKKAAAKNGGAKKKKAAKKKASSSKGA